MFSDISQHIFTIYQKLFSKKAFIFLIYRKKFVTIQVMLEVRCMIEDKIKNLIVERYGSLVAFSEKIGLPNSTIDSILRRGIGKGKVEKRRIKTEEEKEEK